MKWTMKRHNLILAGILVVQIVLSVVVFWPKPSASAAREPLFPDVEAGDIVALTITDADGNVVSVRQVGENWVLPEADNYPANADKITPVREKIVGLETGRLVTRTDASHKRLQVASGDFSRRIDFETADGTKRTVYLGSSPSYGTVHFRVDGQSEVYLTNDIDTYETSAAVASWIDTAYPTAAQEDVTTMTLVNDNGTFTFTKEDADGYVEDADGYVEDADGYVEDADGYVEDADGSAGGHWAMDGLSADETLNETQVDALLQRATSVTIARPLGKQEKPSYRMDEPNAVVTLGAGDQTVTLRVGAKDPADNTYVVISSQSPYYVRVAEFNVMDLLEKTRDDFLQLEPTPTPEAD